MENLLLSIGMDMEDIIDNYTLFASVGVHKIISIIDLLKMYNCNNDFIKECLLTKTNIFAYELERLSYVLESIISNGDMIEEVLLEII